MAYIFDPIRNTFVDDEDTSLGNKLALNDTSEEIIRQIDEQFGPGTLFPASEAPPPPKTIERDMFKNAFKESAADGGMIGGGTIAGQDMGNRTGFANPVSTITPEVEKFILQLIILDCYKFKNNLRQKID